MIDGALSIVDLDKSNAHVKIHDTTAVFILTSLPISKPYIQKWNYGSAIGCVLYIHAMIRPDITMVVQQCAHFSDNPKQDHNEAVNEFVNIYSSLEIKA